jgi:hypothetical protein
VDQRDDEGDEDMTNQGELNQKGLYRISNSESTDDNEAEEVTPDSGWRLSIAEAMARGEIA